MYTSGAGLKPGTGIAERLEAAGGVLSKFAGQDLAPGRCHGDLFGQADDFGVIGIRDDEACFGGQKISGKILIHGPEVAVAPFDVALPFVVRLEISAGRFAFDHPQLPLWAKAHDVNAEAPVGDKFLNGRKVQTAEKP